MNVFTFDAWVFNRSQMLTAIEIGKHLIRNTFIDLFEIGKDKRR